MVLLALLVGSLRMAGDPARLYPLEGDSAKYHQIAQGFSRLYSRPIESFELWISRSATREDLARYGFDSWVLQHAPAYTALLGAAYLLPGDDETAGRWVTILLFALGGWLLWRLTHERFGPIAASIACLLYLLWPAHALYAPAILTEIPVLAASLLASMVLLGTGRSGRTSRWLFGGAALGVLVLTKTTLRFLVLPVVLLEAFLDPAENRARTAWRALHRLAGWGAVHLVWVLFLWGFQLPSNPLAQSGDDWLWIYRGDYVPDRGWENIGLGDAITPEIERGLEAADLVPEGQKRAAMYRTAFFETLRRDRGGMVALVIAKAGIFWRFPAVKTFVDIGPLALPPPARLQPALAVAGLLGLTLCFGTSRRWCLPAVFPLYLTGLHACTHLVSRYNTPAIPFAMLYGSGVLVVATASIRSGVAALRRGAALRRPSSETGIRIFVAAVGLLGAVLCMRWGGGLRWLTPIIAAVGFAPLAARIAGAGRLGRLRAGAALGLLSVLAAGTLANDPDPDLRRVRLSRPGDGVRLTLELPPDARPEEFASAEVLLDLLPSQRGTMTLSVRLGGEEIGRFGPRPPSRPENFLFDPVVHADEDRYARLLRSVDRFLEGNIRRRPGMAGAGYDQFRQWQRISIDPAVAFRSRELTLELVLLESRGGSVDVFLDRDAPARGDPARLISMPAVSDNPFEYSSYRFDALATDRLLADGRLIRSIPVYSSRLRAERFGARGPRILPGEPRMRLRGQLTGALAYVEDDQGELHPEFLRNPAEGIRLLGPEEIFMVQVDREYYRNGTLLF